MTIYEEFIKEGEERGAEKANRAKENHVIAQGVEMGLELEKIAQLTALSVQEVSLRIKELGIKR